ncbi:hypothetical protein CEXT_143851 [Caerostris extrusa]|uniref:Uncharacterized protein n=1 Tax=Caerostris extrusa TaxID=172846 RepID=A0AAV4Y4Z6_CAEEX|nr:hypothetical protein CEXT_143851 [Caerostris extrusa]
MAHLETYVNQEQALVEHSNHSVFYPKKDIHLFFFFSLNQSKRSDVACRKIKTQILPAYLKKVQSFPFLGLHYVIRRQLPGKLGLRCWKGGVGGRKFPQKPSSAQLVRPPVG